MRGVVSTNNVSLLPDMATIFKKYMLIQYLDISCKILKKTTLAT